MQIDLKKCFETAVVACIGDVMLDRFVYGRVDRISPESPVPVLQIQRNFTVLGGAGNVARNILSIGGRCHFLTVSGDDAGANELEELLVQEKQLNSTVLRDASRTTTCKTRFIAGGQQMLRVDDEVIHRLSPQLQSQLLHEFSKTIKESNIVILSDYAKGIFDDEFCQMLIQIAHKAGVQVIVDPKGKNYNRYRGVTLLTPNVKELSNVAMHPLTTQIDIVNAARDLCKTLDITAVLVTQGANGMTLVTKTTEKHIETVAKEVFDVSGAGDTVVATLAVSLAGGMSMEDAAHLANTAAGIVVGKVGTATVSMDELQATYHHGDLLHGKMPKISTREQIVDYIKTWRRQGLTVGFTNGCFDLLHLGHLHILKQAAAACDKLVVAVNTDQSVKRLKGDSRPVHDQETRSYVLEALSFVDAVVLFDEETPLELIELFQPDVLIKGADYTIDRVVGASLVQARGGEVLLVDLMEGHSTTGTLRRIG